MTGAEQRGEVLIIPKIGDVIIGTFGGGLPHLVVSVAERSVEAGAIHTYDDGKEEITPVGTVFFEQVGQIIDHWDDIDRITEAFANNMYRREDREDEVPRIRQIVEDMMTTEQGNT